MKNRENEIERTLNALNGIQEAEPNPFFYTRLKARMEKELTTEKQIMGWQVKPVFLFSVLAMVLIVNVLTFVTIQNYTSTKSVEKQQYSTYNADGI